MARKEIKSYAAFKDLDGSTAINVYYKSDGADTIRNLSVDESTYIMDLLRNEKPISYDHTRKRLSTLQAEPVGEEEAGDAIPFFTLENWLSRKVKLRNAINWEFSGGSVRNYRDWTSTQKRALANDYAKILRNQTLELPAAPPLAHIPSGSETAVTFLTSDRAWRYYIGHVAHSLVVEGDVRVNWSLLSQSDAQITEILDGRSFYIRRPDNTYNIMRSVFGGVTYGNPSRLFRFMQTNDLIGMNHTDTIIRVIGWCKKMFHFIGGNNSDNVFDQWQYRGLPPIESVINGTVITSRPNFGLLHITGGCWGTTGFLRALLRIINIPVKLVRGGSHALPYFMSVGKYLSHGDDPYNQLFTSADDIPVGELLIDETKFNAWFVGSSNPNNNVGRQTRALALQYLSLYILKRHCRDLAAGRGHAASEVAEIFKRNYTVAQLETMNLWTRMDAKIALLGGCGAIS